MGKIEKGGVQQYRCVLLWRKGAKICQFVYKTGNLFEGVLKEDISAMTTKRLRQGVKETHQHKCCAKKKSLVSEKKVGKNGKSQNQSKIVW